MSNGIVLPRHRRLMEAAGLSAKPVAWLHEPTGNVFKDGECQSLIKAWQKQFADTMSPEEIAADFVPLVRAALSGSTDNG